MNKLMIIMIFISINIVFVSSLIVVKPTKVHFTFGKLSCLFERKKKDR